jgi:putative transposase
MADNGVDCSMSRSGSVWDIAAIESLFSSLKTKPIGRKVYRTRDAARADVFDDIERLYHTIRRHSTIGYLSLVGFERKVGLAHLPAAAQPPARQTETPGGGGMLDRERGRWWLFVTIKGARGVSA